MVVVARNSDAARNASIEGGADHAERDAGAALAALVRALARQAAAEAFEASVRPFATQKG